MDERISDEPMAPVLEYGGVTERTMMGSPCLRVHGDFSAMRPMRTGELIVTLPEDRDLVASGIGGVFAPNGRVFRAWMLVVDDGAASGLLDEARRLVAGD
jgi:hypothetical protein